MPRDSPDCRPGDAERYGKFGLVLHSRPSTAAGVAFHFKQWGSWKHGYGEKNDFAHVWPDGTWSHKVDKKIAGRLLDGREWNEFPEAA